MALRNRSAAAFASLLTLASGCSQGWSRYEYTTSAGVAEQTCFLYQTTVLTWSEARAACVKMGGELAVLANSAEAQFIGSLVIPARGAPWIGAYYASSKWQWVDPTTTLAQNGSVSGYTPWRKLFPAANPPSGTCAQLSPVASPAYAQIHERDCAAVSFSMCQSPPLPPRGVSFDGSQPTTVVTRATVELKFVVLDTELKQAVGVERTTIAVSINGSGGLREKEQIPASTFQSARKTLVLRCVYAGTYKVTVTPTLHGGYVATPLQLEWVLVCSDNPEIEQYPETAVSSANAEAVCVDESATAAAIALQDSTWDAAAAALLNLTKPDVTVFKRCALDVTNHYWDTPPAAVLGAPDHYDTAGQVWTGAVANCEALNDSTTFSPEVAGEVTLSMSFATPVLMRSFSVYASFGRAFVTRAHVVTLTEEGRVQAVLRSQAQAQEAAKALAALGPLSLPSTVLPDEQSFVQECWSLCRQLVTCAGLHTHFLSLRCTLFSTVTESASADGFISARAATAPDGSTAYEIATSAKLSGAAVDPVLALPGLTTPAGTYAAGDDFVITFGNVSSAGATPGPTQLYEEFVLRPVVAGNVTTYVNATLTETALNQTGVCIAFGAVAIVPGGTCVEAASQGASDWDQCVLFGIAQGADYMSVDDLGRCQLYTGSCYSRGFSPSHQSARMRCTAVCEVLPATVLLAASPDCDEVQSWPQDMPVDQCADLASGAGALWYQHVSAGSTGSCTGFSGSCTARRVDTTATVGKLFCTATASGSAVEEPTEVWVGSEPANCPSVVAVTLPATLQQTYGRKLQLTMTYTGPVDAAAAPAPTLPQIDSVVFIGEQVTPSWSTNPPQGSAVFGLRLTIFVHAADLDRNTDEYALVREPAGGLSEAEQKTVCGKLTSGQQLFPQGAQSELSVIRSDVGEPERATWYTVCFALRGLLPFQPLRPRNFCGGAPVLSCAGSSVSSSLQTTPPPIKVQWRDNEPPSPAAQVGVPVQLHVQQVDARNALAEYSLQSSVAYRAALDNGDLTDFTAPLPITVGQKTPFVGGYTSAEVTFIRPGVTRLRAVGSWAFHSIEVASPWADAVITVVVGDPFTYNVTSFPDAPTTIARNVLVVSVYDSYGNVVDKDSASTCRISGNPLLMLSYDGGLATAKQGVFTFRLVFASAGEVVLSVLPEFYTGVIPNPQVLTQRVSVSLYSGASIDTPTVDITFTATGTVDVLELRRAVATMLDIALSSVLEGGAQVSADRAAHASQSTVVITVDVPVSEEPAALRDRTDSLVTAAIATPGSLLAPFGFSGSVVVVGSRAVVTLPPKVELTPPNQIPGKPAFKISASRKLVLRSNVTHPAGGAYYVQWDSPDIDIGALTADQLLTPYTSLNLVLAADVLTEGRVYYFTATADDAQTAARDLCGIGKTDEAVLPGTDCVHARHTVTVDSWEACVERSATSGADYVSMNSTGACAMLRGVCSGRAASAGAQWSPLCGPSLLSSSAGMSLVVNAPPSKGPLFVWPVKGEALDTNFSLVGCGEAWSDHKDDYPLTFKFSYSKKGSANEGDAREACGSLMQSGVGGPLCARDRSVAAADAESCESLAISAGADFYTFDTRRQNDNCDLFVGECVEVEESRTASVSEEITETVTPATRSETEGLTPTSTPSMELVPPPTATVTDSGTSSATLSTSNPPAAATDTATRTLDPSQQGSVESEKSPLTSGRICHRGVVIRSVSSATSVTDCSAQTQFGANGSYFVRLCVSDIWGSPTCAEPVSIEVTLDTSTAGTSRLNAALGRVNTTDQQGTLANSHALVDYINSIPDDGETTRAEMKTQVMDTLVASDPRSDLVGETCQAVASITSNPSDIDGSLADSAVSFLKGSLSSAANGTSAIDSGTGTAALEGLGSVLTSEVTRGNGTNETTAGRRARAAGEDEPAGLVSRLRHRLARILQSTTVVVGSEEQKRAAELDAQISDAMASLRVGMLQENVPGERGTKVETTDIAMEVTRTDGAQAGTYAPGGLSTIEVPTTLSADVGIVGVPVDSQVAEVKRDTKELATDDVVLGPVVGFSVAAAGQKTTVSVQNLTTPLRISMMVRRATEAELQSSASDVAATNDSGGATAIRTVACRWWNTKTLAWSSDGCRLVPKGSLYRCGVRHDGRPVWCRRLVSGSIAEDRQALGGPTATATLPVPAGARQKPSFRRRRGRVQQTAVTTATPVVMEEVLCECNHATDFSFGSADDLKPKPRLPSLDITDLSQVSPLMLAIVCGVSGAALTSVLVLMVIDVLSTRKQVRHRAESYGRRALLTLSDLIINRQGAMLDVAEDPSAALCEIQAGATGWGRSNAEEVPPLTEIALERPFTVSLQDTTADRLKNFLRLYARTCIESHAWVSAMVKTLKTNSNFERHQKAAVVWCLVVMGLFINSVWYQHPEDKEGSSLASQLSSNAYASITTLGVLIPSAFALTHFFVYTPPLCIESKKKREEQQAAFLGHRRDRQRAGVEDEEEAKQRERAAVLAELEKRETIGEPQYQLPFEQLSAIALQEVAHRRLHCAATVLLLRDHPEDCYRVDGELGPSSIQAALHKVLTLLYRIRNEQDPQEVLTEEVIRNDEVHVVSVRDPTMAEFKEILAEEELSSRWLPALRQLYCCRTSGMSKSSRKQPKQYRLAACMFQMALLGDYPDLFYLMQRQDTGSKSVREVAEMVIANNILGRSWAMYYAQKLLRQSPQEFWDQYEDSEEVHPDDLILIYGLENPMDPVFPGGVTYISKVEKDVAVDSEHVSWRTAVEAVVAARFLDAAHLFRHAIFDLADARRLRRAGDVAAPARATAWFTGEDGELGQEPAETSRAPTVATTESGITGRTLTDEEKEALTEELLNSMSGLLFADGDPLKECESVRCIEYGRVMARHYALLAGVSRKKFCRQFLRQQRQLEMENSPGALRPGLKVSVTIDVDEIDRICEDGTAKKPTRAFAGRVGVVDEVVRPKPEDDPTAAVLLFSDRPGDRRQLPVEILVYSTGPSTPPRVGQRVVAVQQIKYEGEKKIKVGYQGTIKRISDHGNWLVDFDFITGKLRWIYREDLPKLSNSVLQTTSMGRRYADLDAGRFENLSKKEREKLGLSGEQMQSNVYKARKTNLHLTYAINTLFSKDNIEAVKFPRRPITTGTMYACSPLHRRGNYSSPLHAWTRRGPAHRGVSRGTGTRMNPFVGLESALLASGAGDVVVLLPGAYPPAELIGVQSTIEQPLLIVAQDFHPGVVPVDVGDDDFKRPFVMPGVDLARAEEERAKQEAADAEDQPAPAAVADEEPLADGESTPDFQVARPGAAAGVAFKTLNRAVPTSERLPDDSVEPTDFAVKFTALNANSAVAETVLSLKECRNVVLIGVHVTNGRIGIDGRESELCEVRNCLMDRVEFPHLQSAVDRHLGLSVHNTVREKITTSACLQSWWHLRDYPLWSVSLGYVLTFLYFAICIILILLQTVNFEDEAKAIGWLTVTAITLAIDAALVRPVLAMGKSVMKVIVSGRKLLGGRLRYVEMLRNSESSFEGTAPSADK